MRILFILAIVILASIPRVEAVVGVDVSQLYSTSTYQCIKKNGFHFAIIRGFCSYGAHDHNAVQNLKNAKQAGLQTDIYMFPCRGKSSIAQVDDMFSNIPSNLYGKIWVDVQTNPSSGCSWSGHDSASNCKFLTEIVDRIKQKGNHAGIYGSKSMWQTIFGSATACHTLGSEQLWYAHYDGASNFADFSSFGGWTKPGMKQYLGDVTLCGAGVDKNYRP